MTEQRHEIKPKRGGKLGCRGEGEIHIAVQEFGDVWRGYFHSAGEFGLRDAEFNHSVDDAVD